MRGLPVRNDDGAIADNIGIYPILKRGQIFNGLTAFRNLGAKPRTEAIAELLNSIKLPGE